jgi:hypothetical protein
MAEFDLVLIGVQLNDSIPKTASGAPVKSALESAVLTLAVLWGADTIIGNVRHSYQSLPPKHPAMQTLKEMLPLRGVDALHRLQRFYAL